MRYFPLYFNFSRFRILVVGGGEIALAKVSLLLRAHASITVVAEKIHPQITEKLVTAPQAEMKERDFVEKDLEGHGLVIAATSDDQLNHKICQLGHQHGLMVNAVDQKDACDFIFPAIVDRSPLSVAVCSEGAAPVFATSIRNDLEIRLDKNLGKLAAFLEKERPYIKERIPDITQRRIFFERLLDKGFLDLTDQKNIYDAKTRLAEELENFVAQTGKPGCVYLVGAGPGDPGLLTVKALKILGRADVILYDRLVNREILEYARREARLICVGKKKGNHWVTQSEINEMMVEFAQQGKTVVRLKGGDPFIFGRGGEEAQYLRQSGIIVQVIPGITAAVAAMAEFQLPLTLRQVSSSCVFLTHFDTENEVFQDYLTHLNHQTLVFYMSGDNLFSVCRQLRAKGLKAETPIALVENASLPEQKIYISTLGDPDKISEVRDPQSPSLIVVGEIIRHSPSGQNIKTRVMSEGRMANTHSSLI